MGINPSQNPPNEEMIEDLLGKFAPQPSDRMHAMLRSAPWQKQVVQKQIIVITNLKRRRKYIWGTVVGGVLLAIFVIMFVPSIRAAANQIFHLFLLATSDQLNIQVDATSPGDLVDFSNPDNFRMSIEEVQQVSGFEVKHLSTMPADLTFIGARYDSIYKTVTILYKAEDYILFLTQRPLGKGEDVFSIGAGAVVKQVRIGNIDAEFVVGGWKAVSTQPSAGSQTPDGAADIYAIWDNGYPQFTLRWQARGFIHELRSDGEGSPSQSILINLANELK